MFDLSSDVLASLGGVALVPPASPVASSDPLSEFGPVVYRAPGSRAYKGSGAASPLMGRVVSLVRPNVKRPGSRTRVRYNLYRVGMTGAEYLALCLAGNLGSVREVLSDLNYDSKMGFIEFAPNA